jgi:Putative zinc-finger
MTDTWDCQEARVALGVYVLGAIDPAERVLVDAHLATCEACRAELAEFADLPTLLALVPAGEAIALAEGLSADDLFPASDFPADDLFPGDPQPDGAGPFPGLLAPLAETALPPVAETAFPRAASTPLPPVAETAVSDHGMLAPVHDLSVARRRRQRLAWTGVAAAVVLIGAAFFGGTRLAAPAASQASGSSPSGLSAQHPNGAPVGPLLTAHGSNGRATATVAYESMGWGVQVEALVTGIPVHVHCQMWVVESDGTRVQVGGWQTDAAEGTVWYPASSSLPAASIREFVITLATGPQITVMPA